MAKTPEPAVSGLVPFTTIDFPGRLAAVIFCQGCPWRCTYCHNPHLLPAGAGTLRWPEILAWLKTRRGLLDGVVFSGGEPLLQRGLAAALAEVRSLGFATGLHTAGIYPARLAAVLPLLDWVGFDIKAPFREYASVVGYDAGALAQASLETLLASGVPYEVRSTVPPGFGTEALMRLREDLNRVGTSNLTLQECRLPEKPDYPARR
ncbi:MAG: anaerobic ribonucleoside-triphosphate reductase activating protein [Betaproteobacteria bacterium]|nr:anaerobic ribonucleoside-triphosphate reductase activating protein [Betaproteobacteria bacterium]